MDTAITFGTYGAEVVTQADSVETYFAIMIPLAGLVEFRCDSGRFNMTTAVGSMLSPSTEDLVLRLHEGAALLVFRIERPALEARLSGMLGAYLQRPLRFEPTMRIAGGGRLSLSSRLRALVRDIDRGETVIGNQWSAQALEHSLMTDLLVAQPHNYSAALHADVKPVGTREVHHAVALLESHPELPLSVADVTAVLGVSERTLERGFRRELHTTFRRALHDIRLRRAHDDLVRSDPHQVAAKDVLAYWSLPLQGYTYTAYRRRYGETPSATLHRSR